jgi:hypothetical protein
MTIITLDNSTDTSANVWELTEKLLRYELELVVRHLHMRCIGGDDQVIHLQIPTRTSKEHEVVIRIAKEIFQSIFWA